MRLFNKVAIVGTGLIGGSVGQDIKKMRLAKEVVGVSRHKASLTLAKRKGAIDRGSMTVDIAKGAELVILAAPVEAIIKLAPKIAKIVDSKCIVSDVASTKEQIALRLTKIFPSYVGSHPLAGSEKRGIANAKAGIFKGSLCILTPTLKTDKKALGRLKLLWQSLGSRVVFLSPQEHDKVLAFASHLPHLTAFSLIGVIPQQYLKFASGGLRDTTRIAASDSQLWAEIFLSNQQNIMKSIEKLQGNISRIKAAIKNNNKGLLIKILKQAKDKRDSYDYCH